METTILSKNGRISIPKNVREAMGLKAGDAVDFVVREGVAAIGRPGG